MLRRRPLLRMAATTAVVAGTATAVSGRVSRRQQAKDQQAAEAQAYEQGQMAPPPPDPVYQQPVYQQPAPSPGLTPESINELKELGALHEQGVLTDEEFAAEKAKLLGS